MHGDDVVSMIDHDVNAALPIMKARQQDSHAVLGCAVLCCAVLAGGRTSDDRSTA
jgi:hypothetical protein